MNRPAIPSGGATYRVSPEGRGEPYWVTLVPDGPGWRASVERGDRSWSFDLAPGAAPGQAWVGDRPVRAAWELAGDGTGFLQLDGKTHSLMVETEAQHRAASLSKRAGAGTSERDVRAPMPGLVLAVEVVDDDLVEQGDGIAIIEAMKMENEVTSPVAGRVRGLAVRSGEAVEGNALLCRIEPTEGDPGREGGA